MKIIEFVRLVIIPGWKENTKLLTLAILSVAMGVALIVSILNANESIIEQFNHSTSLIQGKQTARLESVSGKTFTDQDLSPAFIEQLKDVEFAPVLEVKAIDEKSQQSITILGVDLLNDYHFRNYDFTNKSKLHKTDSQLEFKDLLDDENGGLIVTEKLAKKLKWNEANQSFFYGSRLLQVKVNDSIHLKDLGITKSEGGFIALTDITYLQKVFNHEKTYSALEFTKITPKELKEQLTLPEGFRLVDPSERRKEIESLTSAFRFNLQALSYIALLVAAYLISQTIFISFQRKNKLIGTLRVLGLSRWQSFVLIMLEALLIGLIGISIGCIFGLILSKFTLLLLSKTVNELYFSVRSNELILSAKGPLIAAGIGLATCILAGLPSAILSARVNPIINLRAISFKNFQQISPWLLGLFYLAGSLSLLFLFLAQTSLFAIPSRYLGFAMALVVLFGLGLISGLFLNGILRFFSSLNNWFGQLIRTKLSSNYIRLWIATGALICGLSMTISISLMIDSFRETVKDWVNDSLKADVYLSAIRKDQDNLNPQLLEIASGWPEVEEVNYLSKHQTNLNGKMAIIGGTNLKCQLRSLKFISQLPGLKKLLFDPENGNNYVLVSNTFAFKRSLEVGDTVLLDTFLGPKKLKIAGVYQDYSSEHGYLLMDRAYYLQLFKNDKISNIAFYLEPDAQLDSVLAKLNNIDPQILNLKAVKVQTNGELRKTVLKIFDQTFQVSYMFFWIALFISIMTVALTLFSCIEENSYLNLVNRYLGTTVKQLVAVEVSQGLLITIVSIILSIPGGYWLAIILKETVNNNSFGWIIYLHCNWLNISMIVGLALIGAVIGSLYPVWAARKLIVSNSLVREVG